MLDAQLRAIWRTNAIVTAAELFTAGVARLIFGHHLDAAVIIVSVVVAVAALALGEGYVHKQASAPRLVAAAAVFAAGALWSSILSEMLPALTIVMWCAGAFALLLTFCAAIAAQEEGGEWHSLAYFVAALPAIGNVFAACMAGSSFVEYLRTRRLHGRVVARPA